MSKEPMNLTPQQMKILANLAMGGRKNYRVATPEKMGKSKQVGKQVRQRLINKLNTPTPGGDVDPETGDVIGEGVKKAGHPEAFELGLDAETMDNPEYQKILRQKRVERAKQMLNPKLVTTTGDDVSKPLIVPLVERKESVKRWKNKACCLRYKQSQKQPQWCLPSWAKIEKEARTNDQEKIKRSLTQETWVETDINEIVARETWVSWQRSLIGQGSLSSCKKKKCIR